MTLTPEDAARAARAKVATGARIDATTDALAASWSRAWDEITAEWTAAIDELTAASADGQWPTRAQVIRSRRAQAALQASADALTALAGETKVRITGDLPALVAMAEQQQQRLTLGQLPDDAAINWARMDARALDSIVTRATTQVTALTWPLAPAATDAMKSALIRGMAVGDNPRTVARDMLKRVRGEFEGGYRRAENIARTEMISAHRDAAQRSQLLNADVLAGWRWTAALSSRTCPACLGMHGQVFPLDEPGPQGHQSCRCSRSPVSKSWRELGFDIPEPPRTAPTGPEWLAKQPEKVQRAVLGPKRYQAWRDGRYPPEQWAVRRSTTGWRDSFVVGPVAAGSPVAASSVNWATATAREAGEALQRTLGARGVVSGFDRLTDYQAREVARTLDRLLTDHPYINTNVRVASIRGKAAAQASTKPVMNRTTKMRTFGDFEITIDPTATPRTAEIDVRKLKELAEARWLSASPDSGKTLTEYITTHEFGHMVDYAGGMGQKRPLLEQVNKQSPDLKLARDLMAKAGITKPKSPEAIAWRTANISRYGQTLRVETMAEAFADVMTNGDKASELSKAIYSEMIEAASKLEGLAP